MTLFCVVLGACSGQDEITLYIDDAFSEERRASIEDARDAWNRRVQRKLVFVGSDGEAEWLVLQTPGVDGHLGYAQRKRKLVRIDPQTPDAQVYAVALHELGHVLGLKHTKTGVMSGTEQSVEFTFDVVLECERVGACQVP